MLCSMMWSLASQQRRLLSGQKHISFSRDSEGLFRGHAANSESGCRRQKKLTASELQHHQQQFQQTAGCLKSGIQPTGSNSAELISQAPEQSVQQGPDLRLKRSPQVPGVRDSHTPASSGPSDCSGHNSHSLPGICSISSSRSSSRQSSSSYDSNPSARSSLSKSRRPFSSSSCCTSDDVTSRGSSDRGSSDDSEILAAEIDSNESSDGEQQLLAEQDEAVAAALRRIARFIDFRERCSSEVLAKLIELGYDKQCAVEVLRRLRQTGVQDDARFAEMYARGQWLSRAQAPAKIAHELRVRRVAPRHIDAALVAVFGSSKQVARGDCADTQQEAAWEQLVDVCRQRVEGTQMYPQHKRRAKLATWLQRRGHSLSTAFRMFEELGM